MSAAADLILETLMPNGELSPAGDETGLDAEVSDRPMCLETSREAVVKQGEGDFRFTIWDFGFEIVSQPLCLCVSASLC